MKSSGLVVFTLNIVKFLCILSLLLGTVRVAEGNDPDERKFRQAQLCVDEDNSVPIEEGLARFSWIFQFHKENSYIPVWNGKTSPTGLITKFDIKAIKIDDRDSGYQDTLKNWIHIDIEAAVDLEGLYVEAISAPWGIPFGEFITSFDCGDCVGGKTSKYKDRIHIIPCAKRAALSYTHPNVFTIGGAPIQVEEKEKRVFFTRMHFNFRYTQYPGVDHTFAQFLVIAVRNFKGANSRFETFHSQIYELDVADNPIGAFYPFYDGWSPSAIKCHESDVGGDFKPYGGANKLLKLRYNLEFDRCLRDRSNDNIKWFTCPPGPILIPDDIIPTDLAAWRKLREAYGTGKFRSVNVGDNTQFCYDAGTWAWTIGDLIWDAPPGIEVVHGEDNLDLKEKVAAEQPTKEGYECEEQQSVVVCTASFYSQSNSTDCLDYQRSNCLLANITPSYGKDKDWLYVHKNCEDLTFSEQVDVNAIAWGNQRVLDLHGKLMVFTWTVAFNVISFIARFMKEYSTIERKSSYFGIGNWLWYHMGWTYVAGTSMFAGVYLMAHHYTSVEKRIGDTLPSPNLHNLCHLHILKIDVESCLDIERKIHNRIGVASCFFFFLSYGSGWGRPENKMLRLLLIVYHYGMAYIGKALFYIIIAMGMGYFDKEHRIIHWSTFVGVVATDVASIFMYVFATLYNKYLDKRYAVTERLMCPFPEGLDTYDFPPSIKNVVRLMLPAHIVLQLFFYFVILYTIEKHHLDHHDLCNERTASGLTPAAQP